MRHVIIGASAAGVTAAELLRRLDPCGEIILVSRDSLSYSRCMLHLRIAGERNDEELRFSDEGFFLDNHINWLKGANVVEIMPDHNAILLEGGEKISFGRLLIASGSSATIPPIPN
ncbi:MAG: NAD(P)/FAD-dependent oxidoreductase, partial [Planctomycetota bacterium]|nr:NAD(P)/FAD-dependent oxidoreductase [Planctomycetota bacterium]